MNASDRRRLVLLLKSKDVRASLKSFLAQPKRFKKPIQREREAKEKKERLGRKGETDAIYKAVEKRAAGICECGCGLSFGESTLLLPEMDEWLNGNGRRRQKRAVPTCWMLTGICHRNRQRYAGGVAVWNAIFEQHCQKYGYKFEPHIEHAKLSPALAASDLTPSGPPQESGCVSQTKEREC